MSSCRNIGDPSEEIPCEFMRAQLARVAAGEIIPEKALALIEGHDLDCVASYEEIYPDVFASCTAHEWEHVLEYLDFYQIRLPRSKVGIFLVAIRTRHGVPDIDREDYDQLHELHLSVTAPGWKELEEAYSERCQERPEPCDVEGIVWRDEVYKAADRGEITYLEAHRRAEEICAYYEGRDPSDAQHQINEAWDRVARGEISSERAERFAMKIQLELEADRAHSRRTDPE